MLFVKVKHICDNEYRTMKLNDVFVEALELSEGQSCDAEIFDSKLLDLIKLNPSFINHIDDSYKLEIIKAYDYEVVPL